MSLKIFQSVYTKALLPSVFYAIVYLAMPTGNPGLDAYGYATDIAKGENLLLPHHLLYNLIGFVLTRILGVDAAHTMDCLVAMNAVMAATCLYFAYLILHGLEKRSGLDNVEKAGWMPLPVVMFLGATFGMMRFATENETYIAPLLFSLAGTWQIFNYHAEQKGRQLWLGLLLLAVAVLYHQIHVFWYGIFAAHTLHTYKRKALWATVSSALLIALVYFISAQINNEDLERFIFHDAFTNTVSLMHVMDMLKFTGINFLRTFGQMHGNVLVFAKGAIGIWPAVVAVLAGIGFVVMCIRYCNVRKRLHSSKFVNANVLAAFFFQLHFAFMSSGNAEFMVMLPFLLVVFVVSKWQFDTRPMWLAAACLFVWNVGYALWPASRYDLHGFEKTLAKLQGQEKMLFVSQHAIHFGNFLAYKNAELGNVLIVKSPADSDDTAVLYRQIDSAVKAQMTVLTDCVDYPDAGSRKAMISGNANAILKTRYSLLLKDSLEVYTGKVKLYQITDLQ